MDAESRDWHKRRIEAEKKDALNFLRKFGDTFTNEQYYTFREAICAFYEKDEAELEKRFQAGE